MSSLYTSLLGIRNFCWTAPPPLPPPSFGSFDSSPAQRHVAATTKKNPRRKHVNNRSEAVRVRRLERTASNRRP